MGVFKKNNSTLKDLQIQKDDIKNLKNRTIEKVKNQKKRRDKTYTFYCTADELAKLEQMAEAKHLTMSEFFRIKLFNEQI